MSFIILNANKDRVAAISSDGSTAKILNCSDLTLIEEVKNEVKAVHFAILYQGYVFCAGDLIQKLYKFRFD